MHKSSLTFKIACDLDRDLFSLRALFVILHRNHRGVEV